MIKFLQIVSNHLHAAIASLWFAIYLGSNCHLETTPFAAGPLSAWWEGIPISKDLFTDLLSVLARKSLDCTGLGKNVKEKHKDSCLPSPLYTAGFSKWLTTPRGAVFFWPFLSTKPKSIHQKHSFWTPDYLFCGKGAERHFNGRATIFSPEIGQGKVKKVLVLPVTKTPKKVPK